MADADPNTRAQFRSMDEGSQADWDIIAGHYKDFAPGGGCLITSSCSTATMAAFRSIA